MVIDFEQLSGIDGYRWLTRLVIPRPIGWVSTISADGKTNIAPFSWFQTVGSRPPMLMVAVGKRKNASGALVAKDTARNAEATRECVIHLPERAQIEACVKTSADLPPEQSEFDFAGLTAVPASKVGPPRVEGCRVAFECAVEELIEREGWRTSLIIARILCAHVDPSLIADDGGLKVDDWRPIARLGGSQYAELGERFELERPSH